MDHVEHLCDQRLPAGWQQRALRLTEDQRLLQQQEQRMAQAALIAAGTKPEDAAAAATAAVAAAASTAAAAAAAAAAAKQGGQQQKKRSECSVYLASDEPTVAAEMRQKYKHIHVITNEKGLQTSECYFLCYVMLCVVFESACERRLQSV
jgi:hypothetical protein